MHISDSTLRVLKGMITGDSELAPYRAFSDIQSFFISHGLQFPNGYTSRGTFTTFYLEEINGGPHLEKVILGAFDPRRFFGEHDIEIAVNFFNDYFLYDGYQLVKEGLLYKCKKVNLKVFSANNEKIKNLIFASTGPKPEIVLIDAVNNDIQITKNAEYCLVYDEAIPDDGLKWSNLSKWWGKQQGKITSLEIEQSLYKRLYQSIHSKPEQLFFRSYFRIFRSLLGEKLLALIPQVYLHYDPYTLAQLEGNNRLQRQRMDFLLLTDEKRIVIEIDGIQHYSAKNSNGISIADPKTYGEMVHEDRRLKLAGYELFRFGGYELQNEDHVDGIVKDFFNRLFKL